MPRQRADNGSIPRVILETWAQICDKAQILYNRSRMEVSSEDMAKHRVEIVEAIVGEWIEAGAPA